MAAKKSGRKKSARRTSATKTSARPGGGRAGGPEGPADPDGIAPADLSALREGKLYYRIGEVSQITGVKPYVLRYWESEFRLMAPQKSRSKQRLYRQKDIETILAIKRLLYEERYTIAGARKRLREMGSEARSELAMASEEPSETPAAGGDAYRRIRDELLGIRELLAADLPA